MRTYWIAQGTLPTACGGLNREEIEKRGNICKHIADSLWYKAETSTTL